LHPYKWEHGGTIVALRNQEKSRYNLAQKDASTIEGQNEWYHCYSQRDDDIYWCIHNKTGNMIGVIRIYDIKHDGTCCNQGSFIIDRAFAMSGPYAVEAEILSLDFVFDTLQMDKVLNDNRVDNKNMNSISKRVGFKFVEEFTRDDVRFNLFELKINTYNRVDLESILQKWRERE
jgi:RimJ/RimL family protein N-acetyltransferase